MTFGARSDLGDGGEGLHPVLYNVFVTIRPLDASSTHTTPIQILPNVPCRAGLPWVENHWSKLEATGECEVPAIQLT